MYVAANYVDHEFRRDSTGQFDIKLVRVFPDGIVIQLTAVVTCEITAEYNLSILDWFDRDHVPMASTKVSTASNFDAEIVATLSGDFSGGLADTDASKIEIQGSLDRIDFGDIDPDADGDEWDRKKYR